MVKLRFLSIVGLLTLLILNPSQQRASAQSIAAPKQSSCAANIEPIKPSEKASNVKSVNCFSSLTEAVAFATGNRVKLPSAASKNDVDKALAIQPNDSVVIGIIWSYPYYASDSFVFYTVGTTCSGYTYGAPSMPSGWDNDVDSAQAYSNCHHINFWDYSYSGAFIDCGTACPTMGAMANAASSYQITG